jgi:hypothetical protein
MLLRIFAEPLEQGGGPSNELCHPKELPGSLRFDVGRRADGVSLLPLFSGISVQL